MTLTDDVDRWSEALTGSQAARAYLEGRGLRPATWERFRLGYSVDVNGITIPYLTATGVPITVKLRRLTDGKPKYLTLGHGFPLPAPKRHLFNARTLLTADKVIVCEGEFDCMVLVQEGLAAVSIPGVTNFVDVWMHLFRGVDVLISLDGDDPGREAAAKLSGKFDNWSIPNKVVELPDGMDVTDVYLAGRLRELFPDR